MNDTPIEAGIVCPASSPVDPLERRQQHRELKAEAARAVAARREELVVPPGRRALRIGNTGRVSGRGSPVEVNPRLTIVV
jgi:hypothetical protein